MNPLPGSRRPRRSPARWMADVEPLERRDCPAAVVPALVGVTGSPQVAEAGGTATFTVSLSQRVAQTVTVGYTLGGTATFGADYRLAVGTKQLASTGTLTFAPGQTSLVISVNAVDDVVREGTESIVFNLLPPRGAALGTRIAAMSLLDDDAYTAAILQRGTATPGQPARFTLQLSSKATQNETFYVSTSDGTALAGRDYQGLTRVPVMITTGQTSKDFWVPIQSGATAGRVLFVTVEPASAGFPSVAAVPLTIGTASGAAALVVSDAALLEGNTGTRQMLFTVALTAPAAGTVTVDYATVDGYAKVADNDYLAAAGTLTFARGEVAKTVAVTIVGDKTLEADETFTLVLSNPSGAAVARGTGTGTIRNDEPGYVPLPVPWTILVYMTGDDLNDNAFEDINEMESALAGFPGGVRIVVSWDQPPATDAPAYPTGGGTQAAWRTYGRSVLKADTDPTTIASSFDTSSGERNTGDPATLTDFVKWAMTKAPADHYLLQMWGHGGGLDGSQFDSESGDDPLTIREIASALSGTGMPKFDLVSYDNCLMGMAEVGYAISQSVTGQFVASEALVNGTGQDYTTAYSALATSPQNVTAAQLAASMVVSYQNQYQGDPDLSDTFSSVASAGYPQLATALSGFVAATAGLAPADLQALQADANAAPNYQEDPANPPDTPSSFVDLGGFMANVQADANLPQPLQAAALTVMTAVAQMAVATQDQRTSSGISIYLPTAPDDAYLATYARDAAAFCRTTNWDKFVNWFAEGGQRAMGATVVGRAAAAPTRGDFPAPRPAVDWAAYASLRGGSFDDGASGTKPRARAVATHAVQR